MVEVCKGIKTGGKSLETFLAQCAKDFFRGAYFACV